MNRFLRHSILFLILLGVSLLSAKTVTRRQAITVARRFIAQEPLFKQAGEFEIADAQPFSPNGVRTQFYVVHLQPKGFVLLASDDALPPIWGFSAQNNFTGTPPLRALLIAETNNWRQILARQQSWTEHNRNQWKNLEMTGQSTLFKNAEDTTYYFPTPVWGQGTTNGVYIFNYYTPNHWSAGCVATAMAEVLAFYQWPPVGTGHHCYTENDAGQLCADYASTYYDWANTLFKYKDEHTTSAQRRAAGLLTYHAAISVNMDFSANGSTANVSDAPNAFHNFFRLSGHYKASGNSNFWNELINNMKDERPAILAIHRSDGLGHAVVADGYSERNGFFHLNMGWNGSDNGWYDISGTWNAGGYNAVDGATKGIVPSPMVIPDVEMLSDTSFILRWRVSSKLKAQYFELQQAATSNGIWQTLSASVPDTFFTVTVPAIGNYYYRVRARRDDIWWDWSTAQKVALGGPRWITFNVNMTYQQLGEQDSVVLRGNIPPLQGSMNSPALKDSTGDGIYSITLPFDLDYVGQELLYRFAIAGPSGTKMESFNRSYTIGYAQYQNLDTVYFDDYTALQKKAALPQTVKLLGNFPNPFNPGTRISYELNRRANVKLIVTDVLGKNVCTITKRSQGMGRHSIYFDGQNLPSGIYFYRLQAGKISRVGKMVLMR